MNRPKYSCRSRKGVIFVHAFSVQTLYRARCPGFVKDVSDVIDDDDWI